MKQKLSNSLFLMFVVIISFALSTKDKEGKVHLKVTKDQNGEKSVFEKVYDNMDELKADEELREFDILVDRWVSEKGGRHQYLFHPRDDEDETHATVWIEVDEDKTELTGESIYEHGKEGHKKIHKKIKVVASNDNEGEKKVIIMKNKDGETSEIEVEVEKVICRDGGEKIIDKKIQITKDGEKIELDGEDDYEFEAEGDKIKIKIDDGTLELADFSGGKFESNKTMVFTGKPSGDKSVEQTINVDIEKKNGEQFIEVDIKRKKKLNVSISEIIPDDASLDKIEYSLKNNLKPSQLNYYPNPSNGRFNLKFVLDQKEEVTVKVMDILGNEVYREKLLEFNGAYDNLIDLSGKEKGIYILQISQKKKALTRKILIE